MKKTISYQQAYEELEQLVSEIESDAIQIDVLSEKVKRASELIHLCREKLRSIETDTNKYITEINKI